MGEQVIGKRNGGWLPNIAVLARKEEHYALLVQLVTGAVKLQLIGMGNWEQDVELSHVGRMALFVELVQHVEIAVIQHVMQEEHNAVATNGQMEHYALWGLLVIFVKIQQLIGMVNWAQDAEKNQDGHEVPRAEKEQLAGIVVMERVACMAICVGWEFVYVAKGKKYINRVRIYTNCMCVRVFFVFLFRFCIKYF